MAVMATRLGVPSAAGAAAPLALAAGWLVAAGSAGLVSAPPQAAKVTLAMADKMNVCANLATFLSFYFSLMVVSTDSASRTCVLCLRVFITMSCCY